MMKKYILVFIANFLTIPLFSASFAESSYAHKRHEVSISYGILPIYFQMQLLVQSKVHKPVRETVPAGVH